VRIVDPPAGLSLEALRSGIGALLAQTVRQMSTWEPDSEISRFNRHRGGDWFAVSPELAAVVAESLSIAALSGGAFDIRVGPLVRLWGFGPGPAPPGLPDPAAVETARRLAGGVIEVRERPPALRKSLPEAEIDLSAIAKGDAVDRIARHLEAAGVHRYLVEIGGELRVRGRGPAGHPWRIAIELPDPRARLPGPVLELEEGAVATSGDYRNFFEHGGRRYPHVIDPATGRPVAHRTGSVTVLDPSARRADALATALLVLGAEQGLVLAEREGLAAYFLVGSPGGPTALPSPRMQPYLE
jgi:thiamine biosynthesis lipoprotein